MNSTETASAKQRLREHFRATRLALTDAEYAAHGATICQYVLALSEIKDAKTVHIYWPLVARREVDTRPLIHALHAEGKTVALPVVANFEGSPDLRHVRFEGEARMRTNRWGLLEPVDTMPVTPQDLDVVIVPAFGAGRNGHRIGHGRGFYDAFLAAAGVPKIGVVFADCFVDAVPAGSHDVALDLVVTEREVWRVTRS